MIYNHEIKMDFLDSMDEKTKWETMKMIAWMINADIYINNQLIWRR